MSVSKRLGRVSQCAVSLIGVACLSVFANTERNGFIGVEGDAEFYKDGDDTIGIHNPIGAVKVVVEARDGWRFDDGTTKKNVDHEIGKTNDFVLVGRDGESSTKNYLVDDVEHIHESIVSEKHTDNAAIEPESAPDEIILVYAEPDYGAVVPSNGASWRIVQKATHTTTTKEIPCHMPECQWGNGTSSETVEIGPELSELVFSCDVPGAKDGLLTFGHYKIGYYASWTNRFCIEKECHAAAGTNSEISVFKVSVSNDQYIGLDMTDAGKDKYVVKNAKAKIEPTPSKGRYDVSYEWNTNPLCEIVEETKTRQEASYQNLSHKQASAAYQDQRLECQVTISAKDSQRYGSATCTNNFTVVKVDVEIEMPDAKNAEENESIEEKYGAYILYEKDYEEYSPFSPRAVDSLRKVTFKITPEDIPETDEIEIKVDEKCLYEREVKKNVTNYFEAASRYRYGDLKKKKFVLHGHAKSDALRDKQIEITHPKSGAIDRAKFTVVEMDLIPDYDRDHKIDDKDVKKVAAKQMFYWWLNDDADDGDSANHMQDLGTEIPGTEKLTQNRNDQKVNGRTDLLDFFPLWTRVGHALEFCREKANEGTIDSEQKLTLNFKAKGIGFVMTRLDKDYAGQFLSQDDYAVRESILDPTRNNLYEATVHNNGKDQLNDYYLNQIKDRSSGMGILMVEGKSEETEIQMDLMRGGKKVVGVSFACKIQTVLKMINQVSLWGDNWTEELMSIDDPTYANADVDVFYLHGFKVSQEYAKGWCSDAFKRLHQSGSNARFTGITWPGRIDNGNAGKYYHRCAWKAFQTAPKLVDYYNDKKKRSDKTKLRDQTVFMAHSLGNMVVSSAIQDYEGIGGANNASRVKYFILNGAVASEAYYAGFHNPRSGRSQYLVNSDWGDPDDVKGGYPEASYCANWYKLFEGENDDASVARAKLTWKGRFKSVPTKVKLVNFACSEDEVLKIFEGNMYMIRGLKFGWGKFNDYPGLFRYVDFVDTDFSEYSWHKQEIAKGYESWTNPTYDSNMAGWGFNKEMKRNFTESFVRKVCATDSIKMLKTLPVFNPDPELVFNNNNEVLSPDWINKMLACAIPAISVNMGALITSEESGLKIYDMKDYKGKNGWPSRRSYDEDWLHCDIKDVAYYFNYKLWDNFVKVGGLK